MTEQGLPYSHTKPCCYSDCEDMGNIATAHLKAIGYVCSDHEMLALIAGMKPVHLPTPDEGIQIMMEALDDE